jgi:hypothetical protein
VQYLSGGNAALEPHGLRRSRSCGASSPRPRGQSRARRGTPA